MFMLKSLFGKIWSDSSNAELVQLPSGSLYLVRPGSIKGSRECIYKDAVATIRRTTTPHNYQLVITRAYEEGEEQLLEESEEADDERSFLVDERLQFRASTTAAETASPSASGSSSPTSAAAAAAAAAGKAKEAVDEVPTFVWRADLSSDGGDEDDLLELVVDPSQVNAVTRSVFEVTFLQCVFERKYGKDHEEATDEDLEKLKYKPPRAYPDLSAELSNMSLEKEKAAAPEAQTEAKATPKGKGKGRTKPSIPAAPSGDALPPMLPGETEEKAALTAVADLYLYDETTGLFMSQQKRAEAKVVEAGRFMFWLSISGSERHWLSQRVDADMNMNFALDNLSAVWNYFTESRDCYSWLLRFYKREDYEAFQLGFSRCMWETLHEESWGKMKSDEQKYLLQAYEEDVEMTNAEELDKLEAEEREAELSRRADRQVKPGDDDEDDEDASRVEGVLEGVPEEDEDDTNDDEVEKQLGDAPEGMPSDGARDLNSQLAVGYKNDRSFVVRGNRIGVFRHTDDDKLEFATTINKVSTPKGKVFNPSKAMLHSEDSAMVLMDPSNQHSLFKMDLEYGKVVEEWNVHEDVEVQNVIPSAKFAQMSAEQTLVGTSHNGVYRIDPRLSGQKLVDSQFKQYATKAHFSAAATDKEGRLAVASKRGDIRLFDSIGKNAKTALPALGDPIIGVDVTSDGRYVLATCKTYLLLIDTLIGDGKWKGSLGFDRAFPAESKPVPRRLQLKPHHVAYMDEEVSFTPARFDVGEDNETSIVTSSGPFVVNWSFEAVKKGKLGDYQIRRYADRVVQDEYGYNSRNIIVALPHDVTTAKRSHLKKPTRVSLSNTPKRSRSSIVDERY